jgi:hypothetical protein
MPGSYPAGQLKNASVAGWPKWKRKPMRLPTRRAGTPSNSIRSRAAISRQHLRRSKSVHPYSRTVVNEIREIPYARWDADRRLWTVPYRSFDELRRRWPAIEAAAERSEPETRKARREAIRGTEEDEALKARTRERRCKRYPVPADDRPPLTRAIGTHVGVVFFIGTDGELVDPATMSAFYFPMNEGGEYVWAAWRRGALEELVTTWPARTPPGQDELDRGWWIPTLEELRNARRDAKSRRRARQRRDGKV